MSYDITDSPNVSTSVSNLGEFELSAGDICFRGEYLITAYAFLVDTL